MTECVIWTGSVDRDGYGRTGSQMAHRVVWAETNGEIPDGLTIDHLCFTRACVNVEHMRLLSHSENARNQRDRNITHCKQNHEFTPENTYWRKSGKGKRDCKECIRTRARAYWRRQHA